MNYDPQQRNPGITPPEYWEGPFTNMPWSNDIEKILEFPKTDDMAGVLARANFKNDRQRIAAVRLAYRNAKFKDDKHQEMLRSLCASTLSMGGLGKILQTFAATKSLAPDMLRAVLGMQRTKKPEEVHRSSDLRAPSSSEKEVIKQ